MRVSALFLAVVLASPMVQASVVIAQVLYDPVGTESGGEAVELRNEGATAVNISSWMLASETSATDATIPEGTLLAAGATYLITDTDWNAAKDNAAWRAADYEETITLTNTNAGIALKDASGMIVDAVGWGVAAEIKPGLFEGTPAAEVAAGQALVRDTDTNNNAADFSAAEPQFFAGESVSLLVNVSLSTQGLLSLGAALVEDDSPEPGVQLVPYAGMTRTLHLDVQYNGSMVLARWLNVSTALENNQGVWTGELPLEYWFAPGTQQIIISADTQNMTIPVTVQEVKATRVETTRVILQASPGGTSTSTITVRNIGNVPVDVSWTGSDLVSGEQKIAFEQLDVEETTIAPARAQDIAVALRVPAATIVGEYRTMLRMETK